MTTRTTSAAASRRRNRRTRAGNAGSHSESYCEGGEGEGRTILSTSSDMARAVERTQATSVAHEHPRGFNIPIGYASSEQGRDGNAPWRRCGTPIGRCHGPPTKRPVGAGELDLADPAFFFSQRPRRYSGDPFGRFAAILLPSSIPKRTPRRGLPLSPKELGSRNNHPRKRSGMSKETRRLSAREWMARKQSLRQPPTHNAVGIN